ncbi:MAG: four helix bundle protein [Bacteroidetes bacterium]|nr:four helix bundle protein [Bacteroidota bacterium]
MFGKFETRNPKFEKNKKSETRKSKFEENKKSEARKSKFEENKPKIYDLEERSLKFAQRVRAFVKKLPKTIANIEDIKQLVKASGSVGANYIEANESFSDKDYLYRTKVCRKEDKESRYWLRLVDTNEDTKLEIERKELIQEAFELMNILGSIIRKVENK